MAPDCGVGDVAAEEAGDGGRGAELDVQAAVVAADEAGLAGVAGDVGFDCDGVAGGEGGYGGVDGDYYTGGFVAEDVVVLDYHGGTDAAVGLVGGGRVSFGERKRG